ncbi:MAG: AraC family transcriptional regulator [Verrucomicrobiota bacterium]
MIRTNLPGAFFLASCGGEGEVFLDGRWQRSPSGTASLFPPHVLHGIRCRPTVRWRFAWIRYDAEATPGLLTHLHTPVSASFSGEALYASLLALHHEAHGSADPSALHHLVELVHRYALRFAQPWQGLPQLASVWERVARSLDQPWPLTELARAAHCSEEHLRRLCHAELGRSPARQITWMRIARTAELLTSTELKLEAISTQVGYGSAFALSAVFKRWTGLSPSDYRLERNRAR